MRKFNKFLKDSEYRFCDSSYDTKQLKNEIHFLTILDNCSRIFNIIQKLSLMIGYG